MSNFNLSPTSSTKGSSSTPRRRYPWSSLVQPALGVALATGVGILTGGQARALVVNVGGQDWDVTTFTGSYNDNTIKFVQSPTPEGGVMPWWGDLSLATQFATAVGHTFLTPNSIQTFPAGDTDAGPLFAYSIEHVNSNDPSTTKLPYSIAATDFRSMFLFNFSVGDQNSFTWAQATPLTLSSSALAPVPGPVPAIGAFAAFGFSRKLRKRIKLSSNTTASLYGS